MKDVKENKGISKRNQLYVRHKNSTSGITLIALVITIIVLLILAAVSIATLTGENGILTQAGNAKNKTAEADAIERIKVEVAGSYGTDGKIDSEQLKKNLGNISGLTYDSENFSLPSTVSLNGYDIVIDTNGNVAKKITVADAKTNGTVFEYNTIIYDMYYNQVKVPAGFKIANDSAKDVTGGIVIEDAIYEGTKGSQFVWIPVGDIKYTDEMKTITLGRYKFTKNSDGTITTSAYTGDFTEDTSASHNSSYGNAIAKDIEAFKTSANNNHGYYMGRYEAGIAGYDRFDEENRNWIGTNIQVVCKAEQEVWNYITQNKASEVSRKMYTGNKFTSDLINSYAWDTAIVFIQTFGKESNSATYSYQVGTSTDTSKLPTTGTGILSSTTKVDKQCNIFDMAGNTFEWTTETSNSSSLPCVHRGGILYGADGYTSFRSENSTSGGTSNVYSFRPLLYL